MLRISWLTVVVLGAWLIFVVSPSLAQDEKDRETRRGTDADTDANPTTLDLGHEYDPDELHPPRLPLPSTLKLLGPAFIEGFHVAPGRETGPFLGPPLRIWGNGIGTSLWRDPVTGRGLQ